jgi:hypothetical protein
MVAVLNASIFGDLFQSFAFQPNQVDAENRVIVIGGQLSGSIFDQQIDELIQIDSCLQNNLSCYTSHNFLLFAPGARFLYRGHGTPQVPVCTTLQTIAASGISQNYRLQLGLGTKCYSSGPSEASPIAPAEKYLTNCRRPL